MIGIQKSDLENAFRDAGIGDIRTIDFDNRARTAWVLCLPLPEQTAN